MRQVTRLISQRFGFYHVGVFLLDEPHQYAVLSAANSEGGNKMLERKHRLRGAEGIVGYATSTGTTSPWMWEDPVHNPERGTL
jgi:hypothetical protein